MFGVCKICGCTDNHACHSPIFGNCWWVDDSHELCSHCEMKMNAKKQSDEMISDIDIPGLYVEETVCPYPEREWCEGCPRYIEDEGICDLEIGF